METKTDEIAAGVYRFSTAVSGIGPEPFTFNQFLIDADAPMMFHLGHRAHVRPRSPRRWLASSRSPACAISALATWRRTSAASMNAWLAAAPHAQVVHGRTACQVSLEDIADRPPRPLADGEVIDLGGKRMRWLDTPHVPHGWEAGLFWEETGATLFCGDILTHGGDGAALTETDIAGPAIAMEDMFHAMSMAPATGPTLHRLAELKPATLALMHGSSFRGDGAAALISLASHCGLDAASAA